MWWYEEKGRLNVFGVYDFYQLGAEFQGKDGVVFLCLFSFAIAFFVRTSVTLGTQGVTETLRLTHRKRCEQGIWWSSVALKGVSLVK